MGFSTWHLSYERYLGDRFKISEMPVGAIFAESYRYTETKMIKVSPRRYADIECYNNGSKVLFDSGGQWAKQKYFAWISTKLK